MVKNMMKSKRILKKLILFMIISLMLLSVSSYAATMTLGLEEYRKPDSTGKQYGYKFDIAKKIWEVVRYENGVGNPIYDDAIYCIKAEKGFYSYTNGSEFAKVDYNMSYDFKNKASMTLGLPVPSQFYSQILWILDHSYIPSATTATLDKEALYNATGLTGTEMTDNDIEVIQQMALWYFTNYDDNKYHDEDDNGPILKPIQFSSKLNGVSSEYQNIRDYDRYRYEDMYTLYLYFVNTANANADYESKTATPPIALDTKSPVVEIESTNYVLGPYKINKNNDLPYNLEYTDGTGVKHITGFTNQDGEDLTGYTLLDSNKNSVSSETQIKDLVGTDFYISIPKTLQNNGKEITAVGFQLYANYRDTSITYWTKGGDSTVQPIVIIEKTQHPIIGSNRVQIPKIEEKEFDLSLRKFISKVGDSVVDREPRIDVSNLNEVVNNIKVTTATYNHTKAPLNVKVGDIVTYTIRVYNEGEVDGYVSEVTDYLPPELEFINGDFNSQYGWTCTEVGDLDGIIVRKIRTNFLAKGGTLDQVTAQRPNGSKLVAFDNTTKIIDYIDLKVECKVRDNTSSKTKITNIAEISKATDDKASIVTDRDSVPHNVVIPTDAQLPIYKDDEIASGNTYIPGQEDDDDFEKIKVESFDVSLRKFISAKNNISVLGRDPKVDVTNLANGTQTTAIYNHTKLTMNVQKKDIITYTIRVYNEGDIAGYINQITDHLPAELEFLPEDEINKQYGWTVSEDGRTILTDYLSKEKETTLGDNLLDAFDGTVLDYKEVKVNCKVKEDAEFGKKLTNLAEISNCTDNNGNDIVDRDSQVANQVIPEDSKLPEYKDDEIVSGKPYIPGQQDDDDFEKVRTTYFDLALRKFITAVDNMEVTNRIPELSIDDSGKIKYDHTKVPVEVQNGNIVTYTLRIFNEGLIDGYASEIIDDVPDGLEFLPENQINKDYRWKLSEDGKKIVTDYLAKEQEKEAGINVIKSFNENADISDVEPLNPDYRDVKIAFKVTEPNTSDRILINTAEISDDKGPTNEPIEDIDSVPGNDNEWNKEDDLDKEFVKVKYFDLALKKWVSKVILIEDGKQTVTDTGHTGDENPEPIVKVDLHKKELDKVTVKFEFQIKVTNEGEIAGYVKELKDYIPDGLKFLQEDNKIWDVVSEKIVTTKALENVLLQPGESASVPIILTWINNPNNIGLKVNLAEISKDYNDADDTPDIDSTPDNKVPGEDDIDDAPVMLAIETGAAKIYFGLSAIILITIAGGVVLIKKYVL